MNALTRFATLTLLLLVAATTAVAQAPAPVSGQLTATLINKTGVALVFNSVPGGVQLGGNGSSAASLAFGNVSAFGTLATGVSRSVTATNYTISSPFYTHVIVGGSTTYSMTAALASAPQTGMDYYIDALKLTTVAQSVAAGATNIDTDVQRTLNLVILRATPAAGGPPVGTAITNTVNFVVTAP